MPEISRVAWIGRALIVGRGGIGTALAEELQRSQPKLDVMLCGRTPGPSNSWPVDLESPQSLERLSEMCLEGTINL